MLVALLAAAPFPADVRRAEAAETAPAGSAVVCENANFGGRCQTFTANDADFNLHTIGPGVIGNDEASSIRVGAGVTPVLCEHINFGGRCQSFVRDDPNFTINHPIGPGVIGNDEASSIKIVRVTRVWTYNPLGSEADIWCKYAVWEKMGFLNTRGRPGAEGQVGGDVTVDAVKAGDVVAAGRLRSKDGSQEAFDLSAGAFSDAWNVAQAGGAVLTTCGHGGRHRLAGHDNNAVHLGGTIRLDGDGRFAGFGAGTNVPAQVAQNPYQALAKPNNALTAHLHNCYSANDPDGAANPEISVGSSLKAHSTALAGAVVTVTGHTGNATFQKRSISHGGTGTQAQRNQATTGVRNALAATPVTFGPAYYDAIFAGLPEALRTAGWTLSLTNWAMDEAGMVTVQAAGADPDETVVEDPAVPPDLCECGGECPEAVGGTAELLGAGAHSPGEQASASGPSVPDGAIAVGVAAVALALTVGGWYARRRFRRMPR